MKLTREEALQFSENGEYDVIIHCGGRKLFTHRLLLAASSLFLKKIIQDTTDDGSGELVTIILPDGDPKEVEYLLSMFYDPSTLQSTDDISLPALFHQLKIGQFHTRKRPFSPLPDLPLLTVIKEELQPEAEALGASNVELKQLLDQCKQLTDELKKSELANKRNDDADTTCEICSKVYITCCHRDEHDSIHYCGQCNPCSNCVGAPPSPVPNVEATNSPASSGEDDAMSDSELSTNSNKKLDNDERPFKCSLCNMGFTVKKKLKRHLKVHEDPYKCEKCDEVFWKKSLLKSHAETHKIHAKCEECCKSFTSEESFQRHMKTHNPEPAVCEICNKTFKSKHKLATHFLVHSGEKPHKCSLCNSAFSQKAHLKTHMLVHTGERPFSCDICGKAFSLKANLAAHRKIHTEPGANKNPVKKRTFFCQYCYKSLSSRPNLELHEKVHRQEKSYKCDLCEDAFFYRGQLVDHINKLHPNEILIKCYHCSETFDHVDERTKHMEVAHPNQFNRLKRVELYDGKKPVVEKKYVCEFCSKAFQYQTPLTRHLLTHTGERPYKCSQCDKAFAQQAHLKNHMKIHTGVRPYSCDICNKTFAEKGNCTAHRRTHSEVKPFVCVVCSKVFGTERTLKGHMKSHMEGNQ